MVTEWYPVGRHEERKGSELMRVENKYPVDIYEERKGTDHVREEIKLIEDLSNQTVTKYLEQEMKSDNSLLDPKILSQPN